MKAAHKLIVITGATGTGKTTVERVSARQLPNSSGDDSHNAATADWRTKRG